MKTYSLISWVLELGRNSYILIPSGAFSLQHPQKKGMSQEALLYSSFLKLRLIFRDATSLATHTSGASPTMYARSQHTSLTIGLQDSRHLRGKVPTGGHIDDSTAAPANPIAWLAFLAMVRTMFRPTPPAWSPDWKGSKTLNCKMKTEGDSVPTELSAGLA